VNTAAELRVAVITDVHGNLPALEAVLADIDRRGQFDRLVNGGDLCLNGPDPAGAFDLLAARATDLLKGNTDRDIVDRGASDPDLGVKKRASIEWTVAQLGPERIASLAALPFQLTIAAPDGSTLLVVHANPLDLDRHVYPEMTDDELCELVGDARADVLAFGHLHIPFEREFKGMRLFNVAACGAPRDGDRRAVWGEFVWHAGDGWQGTIHRVAYDYGATVLRILDSGMPHPDKRIRDLLRATYA
jgi:predicted phosphodiesterase